jgi:Type II secretory pathway, prepilin signal peptidase PulO and related peptidases
MLHLSAALTAYILALTALLGLVAGSFLNCLAWRLSHGESVLKGRSHCARCGHTLGAGDLIPVVSYLMLKGRCRWCGEKISPRYPLTELSSMLIFLGIVLRYDVTFQPCAC